RILGDAAAINSMLIKLPYSYNLDLQEINPHLYDACRWASTSLEVLIDLVQGLEVDRGAARLAVDSAEPWSAEAAEYLALRDNKPLRATYSELARLVSEEGLGSALRRLGIKPEELLMQRRTGCAPSRIAEAMGRARSRTRSLAEEASALVEDLEASWREVRRALQELASKQHGSQC
ncbi:MAG: hypothetical protein QI199_08530, partial [Candidatus Korarchaeota archaeon]|nr:hypothetical protein [Candidatus Korarchaeota archaeon]